MTEQVGQPGNSAETVDVNAAAIVAANPNETAPAPVGGEEPKFFKPGEEVPVATPATFPENWREEMAGEDEKELKRLQRFKSPKDMHNAWRNAEKKISSGQLKDPFPVDGSDDEKAEWRKSNAIPETWGKYDTTLSNGLVIGENEKPAVDSFLKRMHSINADNGTVKAALEAYYDGLDESAAAQSIRDDETRAETEDRLRAEFGPAEYRKRVAALNQWMNTAPEGVGALIAGARLGDGTPLANNEGVLRWFMQLQEETNPLSTIVPGGGQAALSSLVSEKQEIEKMMAVRTSDYWKGPKAKDLKARYRELIDIENKIKK